MRVSYRRTVKQRTHIAIRLLLLLLFVAAAHTTYASNPRWALQVEGEYYGKEAVVFSLLMTQTRFVKSYSNGITITGVKTANGPVYYFIKSDGKLIVKVSQDNLYRIGEMTNWEMMTKLTRFGDGAGLVSENKSDTENACRWYRAEKEEVRLCMHERFKLPVYVESKGKIVAHIKKMNYTKAPVDPKKIIDRYVKEGYRFVDADEDISPDTD